MILLTTLWAPWKYPTLVRGVSSHADASSAVVVATGEHYWIRVELKADWAAQLMGQLLLWL